MPRVIWMLWLQGWDDAPEIVRACRRTWEALNPTWSLRPLTSAALPTVLDERMLRSVSEGRTLPPEAFANIVRMELLKRYGGVWADATTYCLQPLDEWLPAAASGFFAFAKPGPDRMISNWFLAAAPGNVLIERWAARTHAYWENRTERDQYFWHHALFAAGYAGDAEFRAVWDATPEILAAGPCFYEPYHEKLWGPASERDRRLVDEPFTPLVKLTHKLPSGEYPAGSAIRYLCDRGLARAAAAPPAAQPPWFRALPWLRSLTASRKR